MTVLAFGLGAISLIAWAVNGAVAPATAGANAGLASTGTRSAAGRPGGSGGSQGGPGGSPEATHHAAAGPHVSQTPRTAATGQQARPASSPSRGSGGTPGPRKSGSPQTAGQPLCPAADLGLQLSSPSYWYDKGQLPEFTVTVASSDTRACRANLGSRFVSVVVSNGNRQRVWGSADCAPATSTLVVLEPHVPVALLFQWNRKTSAPGCHLAGHTVPDGNYTAVAVDGHVKSKVKIFVLAAPGMPVP